MAVGSAGPMGDKVRSDLHVRYEPATSGAFGVEIESKVALYYGDAIAEQTRGVAASLGVSSGSLSIADQGALPFVIAARVEAAIRAAGAGAGHAMPELRERRDAPGRDALRRSRLYLPGSEPKYMINAGLHGSDAVILDLEDSVHAAEKHAARYLVRNALATLDFGAAERMVRINQLPLGLEDLDVILAGRPELILIPKVEHADQVREVAGLAQAAGQSPWIMPILESAMGIENAFAIATAHDTVVALTIGLEDYTADLGVVKTPEGAETLWARSRVMNAARAAGVQAIDSVYGNVGDEDGLRSWAAASRAMGFEGMGCLHPRQIEIIHQGYAPGEKEIERALRIVTAFEEATAQGKGVVSLGSKMIDPPVVDRAVKLVERARAMGLVTEERLMAKLVKNAAGRTVPEEVNGKKQVPYQGVNGHRPAGAKQAPPISTCSDYPANGDKRLGSLREALEACGLRDGMTISSHHHLRNGDEVALSALQTAGDMGVKDLMWFPSASFPCQAPVIDLMESGVVHHIEGSMNGPLGDYASRGNMRGLGVLRSHGGRWQAIQDGEVHIDIAVIAAPSADMFGNATGSHGPSACGSLGFALADSLYADKVIVVTDNLVDFPCLPWQIQGNNVDHVVVVDSIGDPTKIVSGTTQITKSPDRLRIARMIAQFLKDTDIMREGFSLQAGAGGIALAFVGYLKELMREAGVTASFMRGGSTKYLVELLEEGYTKAILDGQTFDLAGVKSIDANPAHVMTSPFTSYNFHGKGNFASMVDAVVLGATEVDVNFNANVNTHSDGRLLHGIGGWQNCLTAGCTILAVPSFRDRVPVILDQVTTLTGPGELIDVIATERGLAINPRRKDLLDAVKGSNLPIRTIEEIKAEVEDLVGGAPARPQLSDDPVAVIKWVDGTVIDSVWKV